MQKASYQGMPSGVPKHFIWKRLQALLAAAPKGAQKFPASGIAEAMP
jgi:hypothetical protein